MFLGKHLLRLTERRCSGSTDSRNPYTIYHRDGQKSVVVTDLVAAFEVSFQPFFLPYGHGVMQIPCQRASNPSPNPTNPTIRLCSAV